MKQQGEEDGTEAKRREKARQMRYKKPIVKDLNLSSIQDYLWQIQEECDDIRYYWEDEDLLIDALDGDEDEAYEFKMMFCDLSAECERMSEDLESLTWNDEDFEKVFNTFFVSIGAGADFDGYLGFDSYEEDYCGIEDYSESWLEKDAAKKIERMTKHEIVEAARRCFRVYQGYIALRYRHDCLKASVDILQQKNLGQIQMVKRFTELYDRADELTDGFKYGYKDDTDLDKVLAAIPQEMWAW